MVGGKLHRRPCGWKADGNWIPAYSGTAALVDHHFGQVSFNNVHIGTEVDERHAGEFRWGTARLQVGCRLQLTERFQHVRVVIEERIGRTVRTAAVPPAVVGVVAARGDDPIVPAQFTEADEEPLLAARSRRCTAVQRSST